VILGTLKSQETYNGARDVMRMLETADGIQITLYTTGIYADDGKFQETDIVILPKDFSKSKTELVFDAKAEFQRGNTTVTHIVKDSKAYVMETNDTTGEIESYCGNVPEMPHLDKILDTILNAQVVDEESIFYQQLECPQSSHRLIHAVWEGLDYFYCFDTSGAQLGSFLGPAMVGKINYLSKTQADAIDIPIPSDLQCDPIDLSAMSQSPDQLFEWEEAEEQPQRRRLQGNQVELVRFGTCELRYDVHFGSNNMWLLTSTVFSNLRLDTSQFSDLATPPVTISSPGDLYMRRLKGASKFYVNEHDGFPCVYVHGAGVRASGPELRSRFDRYWGKSTHQNPPCYCKSVHYVKLNTLDQNPDSRVLQEQLADLLLPFQTGKIQDAKVLDQVAVITHGTGGLLLANAIGNGLLKPHITMIWFSMNTPRIGSHKLLDYCTKATDFKWILKRMAREVLVRPLFQCKDVEKAGFDAIANPRVTMMRFDHYVTRAMCGAVATHRPKRQEKLLNLITVPQERQLAMRTLTDGTTRVGDCLLRNPENKISSKYSVVGYNYWESQMKKGGSVKGSVQRWLHDQSNIFLDTLHQIKALGLLD